ncbi:unnamed protein product [Linum tenue]|uniref:Transposase n=1 Tax=Linum tenue TaxID=586396 RepID=A0AAV0R7Z0_9ROSI|nr:unnamed protein product [Linum tenue]
MSAYISPQDCIGAIDGTHFRVKVNRASQTRFRGRKEWPTQNVLASCNFDLQFLYVLAGWEGTASDSRILKDAFARPHGLVIPEGMSCSIIILVCVSLLLASFIFSLMFLITYREILSRRWWPKGKQTIVGETSTKENLKWTEEMDNAFLESLLAEQRKGNMQDGMFTTHAYNNVVITLRGLFSHNFDKEKIKIGRRH